MRARPRVVSLLPPSHARARDATGRQQDGPHRRVVRGRARARRRRRRGRRRRRRLAGRRRRGRRRGAAAAAAAGRATRRSSRSSRAARTATAACGRRVARAARAARAARRAGRPRPLVLLRRRARRRGRRLQRPCRTSRAPRTARSRRGSACASTRRRTTSGRAAPARPIGPVFSSRRGAVCVKQGGPQGQGFPIQTEHLGAFVCHPISSPIPFSFSNYHATHAPRTSTRVNDSECRHTRLNLDTRTSHCVPSTSCDLKIRSLPSLALTDVGFQTRWRLRRLGTIRSCGSMNGVHTSSRPALGNSWRTSRAASMTSRYQSAPAAHEISRCDEGGRTGIADGVVV